MNYGSTATSNNWLVTLKVENFAGTKFAVPKSREISVFRGY